MKSSSKAWEIFCAVNSQYNDRLGRVWNLRDWKWVIGDWNFKARHLHAASHKSCKCCLWKTVFKVQSICNFDLLHLIQSTDDEKELLCFKHKSISKTSPLLFFCFCGTFTNHIFLWPNNSIWRLKQKCLINTWRPGTKVTSDPAN